MAQDKTKEVELRMYKDLDVLRNPTIKDSVYFVYSSATQKVTQIWVTTNQNIPRQVELSAAVNLKPITSPDGSIDVTETSSEIQIQVDASLLALINSALQSGDNVSELVNDAGYITSADTALDTNLLHTVGDETKDGTLTLNDNLILSDLAAPLGTLGNLGIDDNGIVTNIPIETATSGTVQIIATNKTGITIPRGAVVYINGAQGSKATIDLALADPNVITSAAIGIVSANIANNASGYVTILGEITGLNTTAFTNGDKVYLSSSVAGGLVNVPPTSPNNVVFVGTVTNSHATQGKIIVNLIYTTKLDRLVDVALVASGDRQVLMFESSTGLWKNKNLNSSDITIALGYTPADASSLSSLIKQQFTWTSGSQTFTLASNYGSVYSVIVQGVELKDTQYTLVPPNQVTINDTLDVNNYIIIVYGTAVLGIQPYYSQAEVDAFLSGKEDKINKVVNFSTINNTLYPSVQATEDRINLKVPSNYSQIVYVNATTPVTATIFDLANPPVTNDNTLKNDVNNLYVGTDSSTWVYNATTSTYQTKVVVNNLLNQIEVSGAQIAQPFWNGKEVTFMTSGLLTIPSTLDAQYSFDVASDFGVTVTWAITAPHTWRVAGLAVGVAPPNMTAGQFCTVSKRIGTNEIRVRGL